MGKFNLLAYFNCYGILKFYFKPETYGFILKY